jgi:hypothetical protein
MNNHLFMGAPGGMHIFTVENPSSPREISFIQHSIPQCGEWITNPNTGISLWQSFLEDPIVVQGNHAYSTVAPSERCGNEEGVLEIFDVSDYSDPVMVHTQTMVDPQGVAVYDNNLFVCQGESGLFVYDLVSPTEPELSQVYQDIHAYDLIALPGVLFLTGEEGFIQYSFNGPDDVTEISRISVQ